MAHIKPMPTRPLVPKRPNGRPPLPTERRRSARLSMRTRPEVAAHAALVGTAAVEAAIMKIKPIKDIAP